MSLPQTEPHLDVTDVVMKTDVDDTPSKKRKRTTSLEEEAQGPYEQHNYVYNRALARKKVKYHFTAMLKVIVGEGSEKMEIWVQLESLRNASPFYKAAMDDDWARQDETGQLVLKLPESDPFTVGFFIEWAQGKRVGHGNLQLPSDVIDATNLLIDLYLYGQEVLSEGFKNSVMDKIREVHADGLPGSISRGSFERAFTSGLPSGCRLQQFFTDLIVERAAPTVYDARMLAVAPYLLISVAVAMAQDRQYYSPYQPTHRGIFLNRVSCCYHEHKDTPHCRFP